MANAKKQDVATLVPQQDQPLVVMSESANLMAMIGRMATDPNADIDKMERLMAMKERIEAEAARRLFNEAMTACQRDMPAILKGKKNNQTGSKYAELEHINDAITPIYTRHGFSLSFDTVQSTREDWVNVRCRVRHSGGYTEESTYETPYDNTGMRGEVNKTVTHGLASGVSYARRYITIMVFNLTLKGEDNDGNGGGKKVAFITEQQQAAMQEWIDVTKSDKVAFLQNFGAESLQTFPAGRANEAFALFKAKAKKMGIE